MSDSRFDVIGEDGPYAKQCDEYGRWLAGIRMCAKMSLRDCAKALGVTPVRLGEIERGKSGTTPDERTAINSLFPAQMALWRAAGGKP